ncbi:TonB-dependent receptor domain-containing protein [Sphingomonas oryzagri]
MTRFFHVLTTASCVAAVACAGSASAAVAFAIPAGDLSVALKAFASQSGVPIIASIDLVRGRSGRAVVGSMTPGQALTRILAGSGLHAQWTAGAWVVKADPVADTPKDTSSEILVTGTRIRGTAPIGTPLTVIDRKALENSGRATIADYLQTLPQNYTGTANQETVGISPFGGTNAAFGSGINLRGLGSDSTLTLFDGNRPAVGGTDGAFVDVSLIPSVAIDRIEVLTDGASAIYGTDAVAGVVNVRFRDHQNGFETHLYAGTARGDTSEFQAAQSAGKRWSTGGVFLAYQYDHHSRLSGADRKVSTENLTPWGGPDLRGSYSTPGTITAANGEIFGIPKGQDGRNLAASALIVGEAHLTDRSASIDILPDQKTHSAYASIDQALFDHVRLYGRALYVHRSYAATIFPNSQTPYTVPVTNPFYVDPIGTDQPVSVSYDFAQELGHFQSEGRVEALTTTAGLKATPGAWTVDLNGSYGHQSEHIVQTNGASSTRVAIALGDIDPATALNLFGDGTGNAASTLAFIRSTYRLFDRSTVWSAALRVDGPLFDLPAGTVKVAAGAERRHEAFASGYYYNSLEPSPDIYDLYTQPGSPGARHIDAIYAELAVPLINRASGFPGKLDASAAARADWYSDVGRTINPKVGLRWQPVAGVSLRGSWGTAFRAPNFNENVGTAGNSYTPYAVPDPLSPSSTSPSIIVSGYAPDIKPEKAQTWTVGLDIEPRAVPGLHIGATWFDIHYRNRIASTAGYLTQVLTQRNVYGSLVSEATPAEIAADYASPMMYNYYGIPANEIRYIIDLRTQNLSSEIERGLDFDLHYAHPLLGGTGTIGATGTRFFAITQKVTSSSPSVSVLGTNYYPVRMRARGHAGWERGGLSVDAFVNYTGGYHNEEVIPAVPVHSWTTVDAQIGYRFANASPLHGARIALSATNLFDRDPPYMYNSVYGRTLAYDPTQASAIGRLISVEMTFQW